MWGRAKGGILNKFAQAVAWGKDETYNRLKNKQEWRYFQTLEFSEGARFLPQPSKAFLQVTL